VPCGNDPVTPAEAVPARRDRRLSKGTSPSTLVHPTRSSVQVAPLGIVLLDQTQLPLSLPFLQLLLAQDGIADMSERLVMNEPVHAVTLREPGNVMAAVLVESTQETACHFDIERPVPPARQDVDVVRAHDPCFLDSCLRRNDTRGACRDFRNDPVAP